MVALKAYTPQRCCDQQPVCRMVKSWHMETDLGYLETTNLVSNDGSLGMATGYIRPSTVLSSDVLGLEVSAEERSLALCFAEAMNLARTAVSRMQAWPHTLAADTSGGDVVRPGATEVQPASCDCA